MLERFRWTKCTNTAEKQLFGKLCKSKFFNSGNGTPILEQLSSTEMQWPEKQLISTVADIHGSYSFKVAFINL